MSLPLFLEKKMYQLIERLEIPGEDNEITLTREQAILWGKLMCFPDRQYFSIIHEKYTSLDLIKFAFRSVYRGESSCCNRYRESDNPPKTMLRFIGIKSARHGWEAEYEQVRIPAGISSKYEQIQQKKAQLALAAKQHQERIEHLNSLAKGKRSFSKGLRDLIFLKCDYRCCHCQRDNKELHSLGLRLEVDHIIEWQEGGKTSYENGQALCTDCHRYKSIIYRNRQKENKGRNAARKSMTPETFSITDANV